jgi:hypothetical protein
MLETTSYAHLVVLLACVAAVLAALLAIVATLGARSVPSGTRLVWILILLIPAAGLVCWLALGPTGPMLLRRHRAEP